MIPYVLKYDMLFRHQIWITDKREYLSFSFSQYLIHPNKKKTQLTTQFIFNNRNIEYLKSLKKNKKKTLRINDKFFEIIHSCSLCKECFTFCLMATALPEAPDEDRWEQPLKRCDYNNKTEDSWVHAKASL